MDVNTYDVKICLRKMLKLSSRTCVDASINHPYVASSLFFSFLLYVFFPLVFWILVYSIPIVVCSCIALSILRKPKEEEDAEGEAKSDQNYNTRKKTKFATERVHSVRRRRAKEIIMREDEAKQNTLLQEEDENDGLAKLNALLQQDELPTLNTLMQQDELVKQKALLHQDEHEEEEEKGVSSTNCDNCVDKVPLLVEEIPKEIREVEQVHSPSQTSLKHENRNEEGTTNEDDHKNNAMDIGISDTERTKRLESLIARRRSRKMLRTSLMNIDKNKDHTTSAQMTNLIVPKAVKYSPNKISGPFSPGPGSAPSVLIPMRNPFDLPYDPQEEKPILTGDSFHQEFTLNNNNNNNNRDMMFTRHESFSLGPSLPREYYRNRDAAASSGRNFGFRRAGYHFSRAENKYAEGKFAPIMELYESKSSMNSPEDDQIKEIIQVDENGSEESNCESEETRQIPQSDFNTSSSSPASSEEDQPLFKIDREAVLKSLSSMRRNALLEMENNEDAIGNNLSYANSALDNATRLKQQYYDNMTTRHHGTSYSIASDMQVEVSEVSSPPLTIDENMNEDVSTSDGEILERNHLSWDGDDLWAHEINGQDAVNDSLSRTETTSDNGEDQGNNIEPEQHVQDEESSGDHARVSQLDVDSNDQQLQSSTISPKSVLIPILSLSNLDQDAIEEAHQSAPHTAESSSPANTSPESVSDEMNNQENLDTISSMDHDEETSSRSIDAASANDSEATSDHNAFSKSIDQSEDQMVSRESTHDDERQTNSTISIPFDETKQVQDYHLSEPVEKETNGADHRAGDHIHGTTLPEIINSIDNDNE